MIGSSSVGRLHRICSVAAQRRSCVGHGRFQVRAHSVAEVKQSRENMAATATLPYDDLCAKLRELGSLEGANSVLRLLAVR